jgi:tetratricopeptide (TPR) repeat protein
MRHSFVPIAAFAVLLTLGAGSSSAQQSTPPPTERSNPKADPRPSPQPDGKTPGVRPDGKGETKPGAPTNPRQQSRPAAPKQPPGIAVTQPRTPAEREKALADLYAHLATAPSEEAAKTVAESIERLWLNTSSDTVKLLMERAGEAMQKKNPQLALRLLDEIVVLAPDFAEGWNRRAYVHFNANNLRQALGDIRRVLALDPNHFKALDGMANILKDIGQKKGALAAVRKLLEVHPFAEGAKSMQDELARDVEGQSL